MPKSLIRARDVRATLVNSPGTVLTEDLLTQGRYFEADCLAADIVGDFVSITGAPVAGFVQVSKVDISANATVPTVGIIVSKETSTRCFIQSFGIYVTTGLTVGARYWIGSDSRLTTTQPVVASDIDQSVGVALSDTELLLHLESVSNQTSPAASFVFRPGGVAADNVYTDWATVVAALGAVEGNRDLLFDDSISAISIPVGGPYDMTRVRWLGNRSVSTGVAVTIPEGASFTGLRTFTENIKITFTGTTPPIADLVNEDTIQIGNFSSLLATGAGPLIRFSAAGFVVVSLETGCSIGPSSTEVIDVGTAGSLLFLLGLTQSRVHDDSLSGVSGSFIQTVLSGDVTVSLIQPNFAGTFLTNDTGLQRWKPSSVINTAPIGTLPLGQVHRYDTTAGIITQTLPEASTIYPGDTVWIKKVTGGNDLVIAPFVGDTIDSVAGNVTISDPTGSILLGRGDIAGIDWSVLHSASAAPTTGGATADIEVGDVAAEGVSANLAREDHVHAVPAPAAPADVDKSAASAGAAITVARADHKHDVSTATAGAANPGDVAAEGAATSLARSDHQHSLPAFGSVAGTFAEGDDVRLSDNRTADALATTGADVVINTAAPGVVGDILKLTSPTTATWQADAGGAAVSNVPPVDVDKAAASAGVSADASRQDHKHDVSTAAAVELTDSTNAEGVATSLARSDHTHAHGNRGGGTLHTAATGATAGFMSAADKTKLDNFSSPPSHSDLANLTADDHTQYLLLAGRAGGQNAFGGTVASEELVLQGSTAVDQGLIRFRSPQIFDPTPTTNSSYCIDAAFSTAVIGSFIGGVFNASPTLTFNNGLFIWEGLRVAPNIQSLVAPSFAAFTLMQALPLLRAGSVAGQNPLNPLVINAGPTVQNEFIGTRTNATMAGLNWAGQIRATVSGATMNVTAYTGMICRPSFSTVAGSSISFGTIRGIHCQIPSVALFQPAAGTEAMTAYIGLDFDNMATFGGNVTKVAVRSAQAAATNAYFLQHTGTAQSVLGGQLRFDADIVGITFGASQDVQMGWGAAGFWFMQFNGLVDQLRISNPSADRFLFDAATISEFNFNCDKFSLGAQTGAVGNQKGAFVAGAETVTVGGEYSQFLLTQAANDTLNAAISTYAGWTINAPSPTVGTGSLTTGVALNVGGNNTTASTNRIGLRIISNPSGGSGINAALWITAGLSRFDGRVDINNGIALGGGAAATLGTIGGTGPTAAAQAQWVEIDVGGVAHWIPAWT